MGGVPGDPGRGTKFTVQPQGTEAAGRIAQALPNQPA